jgi:hypothetical protein
MWQLLEALNAYVGLMKAGETDKPIAFRRVRIDDVLINDRLIFDQNISDEDSRIEDARFATGNYFALTDNAEFVYTSEFVCRKLTPLFFVITSKELTNAQTFYKEMGDKLKTERERLFAIVAEIQRYIKNIDSII